MHCTIITTVIKLWQFNTVYVHYGNLFSNGLYNIHYVHGINSTYGLTHSIDDIFDFIFGIIFRNKCDN